MHSSTYSTEDGKREAGNSPVAFGGSQPKVIDIGGVSNKFDGKCRQTIHRWVNDPQLNFPKPRLIRGRNYWLESEIDQWITERMKAAEVEDVVADRGYFSGEEILACDEAGITVTLPKPLTSGNRAKGRFVKQAFRYLTEEDVYLCPAGERLVYHYTNQEKGLTLRRYWTNACQTCAIKDRCTTGKERRIARWEHEDVLEAVQQRLDEHPEKMRQRRETVEHPFGTIKSWMGSTHFQMKTLKRVGTEMALHVLAYNLKRVMNILGIGPLMAAMSAA